MILELLVVALLATAARAQCDQGDGLQCADQSEGRTLGHFRVGLNNDIPASVPFSKYPIWKVHKYHGIDLRPVELLDTRTPLSYGPPAEPKRPESAYSAPSSTPSPSGTSGDTDLSVLDDLGGLLPGGEGGDSLGSLLSLASLLTSKDGEGKSALDGLTSLVGLLQDNKNTDRSLDGLQALLPLLGQLKDAEPVGFRTTLSVNKGDNPQRIAKRSLLLPKKLVLLGILHKLHKHKPDIFKKPNLFKKPDFFKKPDLFKKPDFGFNLPDFGFKKPDFGFNLPDFGFKKPDFGFNLPDFGFKKPDFGFKKPDFGFKLPDFGFKLPDFGFKKPDLGFKKPDFSFNPFEPLTLGQILGVSTLKDAVTSVPRYLFGVGGSKEQQTQVFNPSTLPPLPPLPALPVLQGFPGLSFAPNVVFHPVGDGKPYIYVRYPQPSSREPELTLPLPPAPPLPPTPSQPPTAPTSVAYHSSQVIPQLQIQIAPYPLAQGGAYEAPPPLAPPTDQQPEPEQPQEGPYPPVEVPQEPYPPARVPQEPYPPAGVPQETYPPARVSQEPYPPSGVPQEPYPPTRVPQEPYPPSGVPQEPSDVPRGSYDYQPLYSYQYEQPAPLQGAAYYQTPEQTYNVDSFIPSGPFQPSPTATSRNDEAVQQIKQLPSTSSYAKVKFQNSEKTSPTS